MPLLATRAGVAVQTLYAVFGNKRQLLSDLVDVTVAGDDEPIALAERQFVADINALADPHDKLARYARHLTEGHARVVGVMLALAGAATSDADAAAIWRKNEEERYRGMSMFAAALLATGAVRAEHTVETVADVLWLAMDVRNYDWLVRRRGWSVERFRQSYVDTVAAALLEPAGSESSAVTQDAGPRAFDTVRPRCGRVPRAAPGAGRPSAGRRGRRRARARRVRRRAAGRRRSPAASRRGSRRAG